MDALTLPVILIIVTAIAVGTFAKGITGVGLPILAMPIMAGFFGVERAVLIMIIPSLFSNTWLVLTHRDEWPVLKRLVPFLVAAAIGGVLGSLVLVNVSARGLSLLLASVLGLYLLHQWRNPSFRLSDAQNRWAGPIAGLAAGAVQGTSGISAPVIAPYYHAIGLTQRTYVCAISATFLMISVVQVISLTRLGLYTPERVFEGVIALAPVVIFLPLGMRMAKRISRAIFDRLLISILVLMEFKLLYDGLLAS